MINWICTINDETCSARELLPAVIQVLRVCVALRRGDEEHTLGRSRIVEMARDAEGTAQPFGLGRVVNRNDLLWAAQLVVRPGVRWNDIDPSHVNQAGAGVGIGAPKSAQVTLPSRDIGSSPKHASRISNGRSARDSTVASAGQSASIGTIQASPVLSAAATQPKRTHTCELASASSLTRA